ncbi:OsmC family protein [Grimontia sp. NTOU-MAR1]|uniref:OsmC family protein n=1 Tax=Grimontia sp. NTOU-MAR1 TaxID=3111011 RepID=UPI002DB7F092|nr:OsmC family protein [Grimontia sp. NTOU-MAR1]WRV99925.1 OsmC family protein [Grimontia sp. NTOU-MAR1]
MSKHIILIKWLRINTKNKITNQTSFVHEWVFDGGIKVVASPSPFVMPELAKEDAIDPEEAFIAAISSCHMMTFLTVAEKQRFTVDSYTDEAIGTLGELENGRTAVTDVVLKPKIVFCGDNQPTSELVAKMHKLAHKHCFIANSVTTKITVESD